MEKLKKINIIFLVLFIITFIIGTYFVYKYIQVYNIKPSYMTYLEKNMIDYKVYLKENDFFEEPYLEKGNAYITTLIDYLDVSFNNHINFSENTSGSYTYYVKGTILATKQDESKSKYWDKEYILSEKKTVEYNDVTLLDLEHSVNVDYQLYNNLLLEFKNNYKIAFDGSLQVELYFINNIEKGDKTFEEKSVSMLSIPLTQATIEVPVEIDETEKTKTIELEDSTMVKEKLNNYFNIIAIIIGFLALEVFVLSFRTRKIQDKNSYEKRLRKIKKEYDTILVNLNNSVKLGDLNVIDVSDFGELIDAHSEVRQPINCKEFKNRTEFVLINDKYAWRYILKKEGARYEENQ